MGSGEVVKVGRRNTDKHEKQFDDIILNVFLFVHSRDAMIIESDFDCELIFVRVIVNILDSGDNLVEEVLLDLLKSGDLSIASKKNTIKISKFLNEKKIC